MGLSVEFGCMRVPVVELSGTDLIFIRSKGAFGIEVLSYNIKVFDKH